MQTLVLDQEKFSTFLDVLGLLRNSYSDFVLDNGVSSQYSNTNYSVSIVDMRSIFGENVSFVLSNIGQKLDLLEPWRKQLAEKINLEITDRYIRMWDDYSEMRFMTPSKAHLQNILVSPERLAKLEEMDRTNKLLTIDFSKPLVDRLSSYAKSLSAGQLVVKLDKTTASFQLAMCDNKSPLSVSWIKSINLNEEAPSEGLGRLSLAPFPMSVGQVNYTLCVTPDKGKTIMSSKILCEIGNNFKVPIKVFIMGFFEDSASPAEKKETTAATVIEELEEKDIAEVGDELDSLFDE